MQNFTKYYEAIAFLEGFSNLPLHGDYLINRQNLGIYLKRMRYFLSLLGNPDKGMKFIHVTGTAGKGSTTNMLHEVLLADGRNVGSFTSPFVTTSIEKIRVGDLFIAPNEFADIVEKMKPAIDKAYVNGPYGRPSYFEIFLAIALIYFKQKKCEWVVLEVGLGGRYDATNVIENPVITAITNIDYDHMEILGDTLEKIAFDKAGIIKKNSLFFTGEQRPRILDLFKKISREKKAKFHQIEKKENHKKQNEALVVSISKALGIDGANIEKGIARSHLQCRFEVMQNNPTVILDGAHNRVKVASTLNNLSKIKYRKLFLIIGIADNKAHASILSQVVPLAHYVYFTRFQTKDRKCAHPTDLLKKSKKFLQKDSTYKIHLDSKGALNHALDEATKNDVILVVGSFFLAGELRKNWIPEEQILHERRNR